MLRLIASLPSHDAAFHDSPDKLPIFRQFSAQQMKTNTKITWVSENMPLFSCSELQIWL
jgi:hypothetical protein